MLDNNPVFKAAFLVNNIGKKTISAPKNTKITITTTPLITVIVKANDFRMSGNKAQEKAFLNIARKLISESSIDFNLQDDSGNTPLHRAAWYGYPELVKDMLDGGADPTIKNERDESVLDNITQQLEYRKAMKPPPEAR